MSTTTTWPGGATDASPTAYSIPASGELNWSSLSDFINVLATSAQSTTAQKWGVRVATTTPVTVSATADCVIATKLAAPGAVAVTLPAGANKQVFVVVDQTGDAATNNVTITPNGAETINGAATYVMSTNREAVVLVYSTTNTTWNVVARYVAGVLLTNPMATTGDMIYGGASGVSTKLATGATAGVLHGGNAAVPSWSTVVNADVSASAAIAGSKIVSASASVAGVVDTSTQTFAGAKTFSSQITGSSTTDATSATTGAITTLGGISAAKQIVAGNGVICDDDTTAGGATALNYYREDSSTTTTWSWSNSGSSSASASTTYRITRIGRFVQVVIDAPVAIAITGSCTNLTPATVLPAWARPAIDTFAGSVQMNNNGTFVGGYAFIQTTGNVIMRQDSDGNFTGSSMFRGAAVLSFYA